MANKRLERIAQMLPTCGAIADIGCDHGKLAALLLKRGQCQKVIAVDVSLYSIEKTLLLAKAMGMEERVDARCGDGFSRIEKGEVQAAVLAGLGGRLIADIIEAAGDKTDGAALVLQPMQQAEILREYLHKSGFRVADEAMVEENGRIHELMRVERGEYELPPGVPEGLEYEVGPLLWARRDALLAKRMAIKARAVERSLNGMRTEALERRVRALFDAARILGERR